MLYKVMMFQINIFFSKIVSVLIVTQILINSINHKGLNGFAKRNLFKEKNLYGNENSKELSSELS